MFHRRSKYHFIRECVEKNQIDVEHVPGKDQLADILTKALAKIKFKEMRKKIQVLNLNKDDMKLKGENVG